MGQEDDPAVWSLGYTVGRLVREVRERRRWTQADLADRVKALGGSLETKAVASIEAAKRRVSVDEALQLAIALDVSPLHLILPRRGQAIVFLAPWYSVTAREARAWIRGQEPLPDMDERTFWTEVPDEEWLHTAAHIRRVSRQEVEDVIGAALARTEADVKRAEADRMRARAEGDPTAIRRAEEHLEEVGASVSQFKEAVARLLRERHLEDDFRETLETGLGEVLGTRDVDSPETLPWDDPPAHGES